MNSTKSLERDVFISYAHVDNTGFTEEQQGWVSAFDSALQKRLAQLLGRKADIWRDRKLTGADRFAREIVDQFANLKVLVSIVSPRYLESKWCRKELETFIENAEHSGGARVGNKTRVFKVVKTPVPRDQYPPVFSEVLGYDFFELTNEARFREFTLEKGSPTYYKFIERFEDVAQDICQLIKMLDAGIQHHDEPDREKTVYLAKSTSDLDSARDNIRRDLEKRGYTVFPDQELPVDGRFRAVVEAFLQRCILAIHLIGNKYGVVPEDEQCSMVEIQHALSQLLAPKRLIWIPESGIGDIDPRQQRFIDDLLHGTDTGSNTDLLNGSLEELKTVIIDTLEKPSKPESAGGEDTGRSEIPRVYLIFDESDRDTVVDIEDFLLNQNLDVLTPVFEGDESAIRELHQDNLKLCDGVLVYCNRAGESWLKFKANDLRKAPGYREGKPLKARAVYLAGEHSRFKERFHYPEASIIKQFAGFSDAQLQPFLSSLQRGQWRAP